MNKNVLINTIIVVSAVVGGLALSMKPWEVYRDQKALANEQVAEMRTSEAKREELVRKDAELKTSAGRERLARDQGYLKPGEVPAGRVDKG